MKDFFLNISFQLKRIGYLIRFNVKNKGSQKNNKKHKNKEKDWKGIINICLNIVTIVISIIIFFCIQKNQVKISEEQLELSKSQFDIQKLEREKSKHMQPFSLRLLKFPNEGNEIKEKIIHEYNGIKKELYINTTLPVVRAEILSGAPKRAKILNISYDYFMPYIHLYSKEEMGDNLYDRMLNTDIPISINDIEFSKDGKKFKLFDTLTANINFNNYTYNIKDMKLYIPFYSQIESTSGDYEMIFCFYAFNLTENKDSTTDVEVSFFYKSDINFLLKNKNKTIPIVYLHAYQELEKQANVSQ